jgi:hypothetical protein
MEEVAVFNVGDLTIVDPETQVARIGGTVGRRKRRFILKEALELGIRILNPGDIDLEEEEVSEAVEDESVEEEAVPEEVEEELLEEEEETPEVVEADAEEAEEE